jgi:hypothetical protein
MVKTWKLVIRFAKNSRFKGGNSLDSFPTKNIIFEMQCLMTEIFYVHHPDVILKSKTIKTIPTYGYMCFAQWGWIL